MSVKLQVKRPKRYLPLIVLALLPTLANGQEVLPKSTVDGWMNSLSNWGRWGPDDEKGTVNFITPQTRIAAAKLVAAGVSVSMAHETLVEAASDNFTPYEHRMTATGSGPGPWASDHVGVSYHGYAHSHLDALCHRFHEGKMYNGYSQSEVTAAGCDKLSIMSGENGIFGRGVLMDMAALQGKDWLDPTTPIMVADLEAWEEQAGVTVGRGDIVLIRTGRWALRDATGPWNVAAESAGLHAETAAWLKEREVALIGSDVALDVFPSRVEGYTHPVHALLLVALGMPIFDNLDLEAVAKEAQVQQRWEFLFTTAPLRIVGGTGSPLNPIATF